MEKIFVLIVVKDLSHKPKNVSQNVAQDSLNQKVDVFHVMKKIVMYVKMPKLVLNVKETKS